MRNSDGATTTALANARDRGLVPRQLVSIWAQPIGDGEGELFAFWNGILPVEIEVVSGETGALEQRAFAADGALAEVGRIRLTTDLSVRHAEVKLNPAHPRVALMLASSVRGARVEIHRVPLDPRSQLPVAAPRCRFRGHVETLPDRRPAVGEHGALTVRCVSDSVLLTRTNPLKRSDESQRRRQDDRMLRYAAVAPDWEVSWGEAEGKVS